MANLNRIDEVVATIKSRDQQMSEIADSFFDQEGQLLVSARKLGEFLGYKDTDNFLGCVNRAKIIAADLGQPIEQHFRNPELYDDHDDIWLTPWAANLSIIEGDARKPRVAAAKSYFATLADPESLAQETRLKQRQLFKQYHKELHSAAELAGVKGKDHALFDHYGYKGMYNRSIREVETLKGVPKNKSLVDCAGATELAANNLRMAMTRDALKTGAAKTPSAANKLHFDKGRIVRNAVHKGTGEYPEHLQLESDNIDKISSEKKKELRGL